jgi:CRP/FNR family transcriptional regulator, cyclic AMP receptor protein
MSPKVKLGHHAASGDMQALFILGPGDSFGELACLGQFPRVVDAEAVGKLEMIWISDTTMTAAIARSPAMSGALVMVLSQQLQEALDRLIVFRNMPAPKRLAQNLLALTEGKHAPVKLGIRQQELAELVGVSRMTIASALAQLEELGLVTRHYRHLVVTDPVRLRRWMKS